MVRLRDSWPFSLSSAPTVGNPCRPLQPESVSLTTKQLTTIGRILDRHRVSTVPTQAAPDQLTLIAEPVTHVVEALRPTRLAQPVRKRVKRKQERRARGEL